MAGVAVGAFLVGLCCGVIVAGILRRLGEANRALDAMYEIKCTKGHLTVVRIDLYSAPTFDPSCLRCVVCGQMIFCPDQHD